jgi:importin subunit beta-1
MGFLASCMADQERTDAFCTSTLGLIGDFGDTYKRSVRDDLMQEWVQGAIAYGRQRGASKAARTNAAYAQKVRSHP